MSCYTHKMAIVSWPQTLWRHFTQCISTANLISRREGRRAEKEDEWVPAIFRVKLTHLVCAHVPLSLLSVWVLWRPTAGKVTVGLASMTWVVCPPTGSRPKAGRWAPRLHPLRNMAILYFIIIIFCLTLVLNSQGMKKITLCNTKKYKNQAGMNLIPPPSQNSHAVGWHKQPCRRRPLLLL